MEQGEVVVTQGTRLQVRSFFFCVKIHRHGDH